MTDARPTAVPAPHPKTRPTLMALAVRSVLLSLPLIAGLLPHAQPTAQAAETAEARRYDVPAGPLAGALLTFATQAGIQLSADAGFTGGQNSPGVRGRHTFAAALAALLAGTGLEAVNRGGNEYTLRRLPARQGETTLAPVKVSADTLLDATTENTGSYTTGSMSTATKLPLSIRETPQTVTVLTRQRIEDQSMNTLSEAVKYTPGLKVEKWGGERDHFISRGFDIDNLMIDGLPTSYAADYMSTGLLSMYDRIEVVRGVSGLMEGVGSPGGSINLVRKRPTREFQASVTAAAGSWDNYRTELDISGPLTPQGGLRGRAVVSYQDKNSFIDDNENKRSLLYGVLEGDIGENTLLRLGASWSRDDNPGADWNGWGTYLDGSFLPISRSTRMSPSWSYWDKESTTVFAELEHRLSENWTSRISATHVHSESDILGTYLGFSTDHNPYFSLGGAGQAYRYDQKQYSIDGLLSGSFSLLGNTHDLVMGASHRKTKANDRGARTNFSEVIFDPTNWDPRSVPKPSHISDWNAWYQNTITKQSSAYVTSRFTLNDQLRLILSGRLDWYEYENDHVAPVNNASYKATRELTPYVGLVYQLNDNYSAYISATRIFKPQNYQTPSGGLLDPQQGSNYEIGLKGEYLGGRLNASLAVFQLDLENMPVSLPTASCLAGQTSCYTSAGKVRSRGIDLELNGSLTDNWQIGAGYTYNHAKVLGGASYNQIGIYVAGDRWGPNLPLNLFKAFTSYRLSGKLQDWKIGGGVHAQSRIYAPYGTEGIKQGGYTIVDLYLTHTLNRNTEISFNINNAFDKKYYSTISSPWGANFFGDPRNFIFTVKHEF